MNSGRDLWLAFDMLEETWLYPPYRKVLEQNRIQHMQMPTCKSLGLYVYAHIQTSPHMCISFLLCRFVIPDGACIAFSRPCPPLAPVWLTLALSSFSNTPPLGWSSHGFSGGSYGYGLGGRSTRKPSLLGGVAVAMCTTGPELIMIRLIVRGWALTI